MIFALLIAAIIWNLGTCRLGLPNSSSHTLNGVPDCWTLAFAWVTDCRHARSPDCPVIHVYP